MKKFLIGGLVLGFLLGLNGCKQATEPEEAKKVVEAKYRGEFWNDLDSNAKNVGKLIVRETELNLNKYCLLSTVRYIFPLSISTNK